MLVLVLAVGLVLVGALLVCSRARLVAKSSLQAPSTAGQGIRLGGKRAVYQVCFSYSQRMEQPNPSPANNRIELAEILWPPD